MGSSLNSDPSLGPNNSTVPLLPTGSGVQGSGLNGFGSRTRILELVGSPLMIEMRHPPIHPSIHSIYILIGLSRLFFRIQGLGFTASSTDAKSRMPMGKG